MFVFQSRKTLADRLATGALGAGLGLLVALGATAQPAADAINQRLYDQLGTSQTQEERPGAPAIEMVSGQAYLSQEAIAAGRIREALAAMLDAGAASDQQVAAHRPSRLNFEIHFEKNSAELTPQAIASLDELADALTSDYLETKFVLGGHTDQDGPPEINRPLSEARAKTARGYLVSQRGIDPERLIAEGFGSDEPLLEVEASPQDKLYNRRVDLRPAR